MIVFMPMLGLGGGERGGQRYLGAARRRGARHLVRLLAQPRLHDRLHGLYVLAPHALLFPAAAGADPAVFAEVERMSVSSCAVSTPFDMMNGIFAALRRGGDTFYTLALTVVLPGGHACPPISSVSGRRRHAAWTTASAYIVLLGLLMMRRFRAGRWKSLRVIEPHLPDLEAAGAGR
jgi:hypothetical protein